MTDGNGLYYMRARYYNPYLGDSTMPIQQAWRVD